MIVATAAAAARSSSLAGALHRVASGGSVFGFEEGPCTLLCRCLFPTVLPSFPVLPVPQTRFSSSSGCFSEGSQFSGDLPGHIQSTSSFSSIFFRSLGLNCLGCICSDVTVSISILSRFFVVCPCKVWPPRGCCVLQYSCCLCCLLSI